MQRKFAAVKVNTHFGNLAITALLIILVYEYTHSNLCSIDPTCAHAKSYSIIYA